MKDCFWKSNLQGLWYYPVLSHHTLEIFFFFFTFPIFQMWQFILLKYHDMALVICEFKLTFICYFFIFFLSNITNFLSMYSLHRSSLAYVLRLAINAKYLRFYINFCTPVLPICTICYFYVTLWVFFWKMPLLFYKVYYYVYFVGVVLSTLGGGGGRTLPSC